MDVTSIPSNNIYIYVYITKKKEEEEGTNRVQISLDSFNLAIDSSTFVHDNT